jgi:methionyl-tRNA formyltransferase
MLPRELLEMPKLACLNLHASLLPRWRGAAPIQAAIAAGDRETGMTVMYVTEELDAGDILLQRKIDIAPNETGGSLHDRLARIAPDALLKALELFPNAPRIAQDKNQVTYAPKLNREDGKIDWCEPAEIIERKIRAFNPWPGTLTRIDNRNLKVFSAGIVDLSGTPGAMLSGDEELVIAAGNGALALTEVQPEGKRRMTGAEFLRGRRPS